MTQETMITALGVFIGALGLLFTVGAIVVTFVLFRQSADYQRRLSENIASVDESAERALREYRTAFESFMAESSTAVAAKIANLVEQSEKATGSAKQRIDRDIEHWQEIRAAIAARLSDPRVAILTGNTWSDIAARLADGEFDRRLLSLLLKSEEFRALAEPPYALTTAGSHVVIHTLAGNKRWTYKISVPPDASSMSDKDLMRAFVQPLTRLITNEQKKRIAAPTDHTAG